MESYVEVSFLHNACTILLSTLVGEYASMQPLSLKRAGMYACSIAAAGCFFWFPYAVFVVVSVELLSFFFFFRHAHKAYAAAYTLRILCLLSAFVFYGGGFHCALWFVPAGKSNIYVLWLLYFLAFVLLAMKWKDVFAQASYVYEAKLYLCEEKLKVKGYLDSGNLLTYKGVPILFIDKVYQAYFKEQRIELVVMNSVTASEVIRCYACHLKIAGCRIQEVYVNCDRHLQLPFDCEMLLNVKAMTTG